MQFFVPTEGLGIIPLLFLMLSYGFILMNASKAMAEGSELLLDVFGPGIVGGILIPILGALPDAMMILMSGLGNGTKEEIAKEIQVGLGTLAGSTIMLLTLALSLSVYLARRQLGGPDMRALTKVSTKTRKVLNTVTGEMDNITITSHVPMRPKQFSLFTVGATGLSSSRKSALICMTSSLTYLIIQIPALIYGRDENAVSEEKNYALFGFVVSIVSFFAYLIYTYFDNDAQEIVLEKQRQLTDKFALTHGYQNMKYLLTKHVGDALDPFQDSAELFKMFDKNMDGVIGFDEMMEGFKVLGFHFEDDDQSKAAFGLIDLDDDNCVSLEEFTAWIEDFLLHKYLVSLPAPAHRASVPNTLPLNVRQDLESFLVSDTVSLSYDLPSEHRNPIHIWAASIHDLPFVVFTHCKASTKPNSRTITITKYSDASHIKSAIANIRPQLIPFEHGYPVWACASPALKAFYKESQDNEQKTLEKLFLCTSVGESSDMTRQCLHKFAAKYHLPMTTAQLNFCFYARDTNFDGVWTIEDFEGFLVSLVDAHFHRSPTTLSNNSSNDGLTEGHPLIGKQSSTYMSLNMDHVEAKEEPVEDSEEEEEEEESSHALMTNKEKMRKAFLYIIVGTLFVTIVSDPMCEVISALGEEMGVNPFYVSFIVTPIVSNASEIIASLNFASKATDISFGTTVSTLLAAGTMNNTLCVSIFMGLIYARGLTWDYFAETITTMCIIFIAATIAYRQTIKLWQAVLLFLLFPISIAVIYVLNKYAEPHI